mmetsp:Transcript_23092/g.55664  ORF Transcript_23092/g.55664 Transcript_23092/m.55664 type:complete len:176 (+) Transcript_23092:1043-1570(+)
MSPLAGNPPCALASSAATSFRGSTTNDVDPLGVTTPGSWGRIDTVGGLAASVRGLLKSNPPAPTSSSKYSANRSKSRAALSMFHSEEDSADVVDILWWWAAWEFVYWGIARAAGAISGNESRERLDDDDVIVGGGKHTNLLDNQTSSLRISKREGNGNNDDGRRCRKVSILDLSS